MNTIKVLAFSLYGPLAASHRVRISQFIPGLHQDGIKLDVQSLLSDLYLRRTFSGSKASLIDLFLSYLKRLSALFTSSSVDLYLIYGELLPLVPSWLELFFINKPYIYDFDDAFYLKYAQPRFSWLQPLLSNKTSRMISSAALVTAGNYELVKYARQYNPNVVYLPSVIDVTQLRPPLEPKAIAPLQPFTVGWIGTPSTAPFLNELIIPLERLSSSLPVRLIVVGGPAPDIPGVHVIQKPWSLDTELSLLQSFDVGVMPLPDTAWTRGKCAYKLLQCMACGVPVVASPVGANCDAVPPTCGTLVSSADEWHLALYRLATNPFLRSEMGLSARHWVETNYSLHTSLPVLSSAIRRVVQTLSL